ncbi:hypothetical protein PUR61_05410 [Streptomyces sp. BE20]|uniref:hypothetical protein n=1 Tax=Streptomyces sp. BE20 TaxID=3002525 RepID=UPI002E772926|nr:hypothetical protein [Streptomyces sp. BE20]MEE1821636.1 hypothetical protein [Streptomyces sp. BE20]
MQAVDNGGPLGPSTMTQDLVLLVSTALVAQARALTVDRQQDAAEYVSDPFLAAQTRDSQEKCGSDAAYFLDRLLPGVTACVSDAEEAGRLVAALGAAVPARTATGGGPRRGSGGGSDADASAGAGGDALGALVTRFEEHRTVAQSHAKALSETASRTAARSDELETALQQRITALQGPDGGIQRTRDAIAEVVASISADLDAVVSGAKETGSGVTAFLTDKIKLVTGTLSRFGGADSPGGGQPPGAGGGKTSPGGPTAAPATAPGPEPAKAPAPAVGVGPVPAKPPAPAVGPAPAKAAGPAPAKPPGSAPAKAPGQPPGKAPAKPFDVAALGLDEAGDTGADQVGRGTAALGAALASYRAHNAVLADLYHALAAQNAELAVAAAIGDQTRNFALALSGVATAAAGLAATWQSLVDRAAELEGRDLRDVAAAAAAAAPRWTALAAELAHVRAAVSGRRGAIPDVGVLPTASRR